MEFVANWSDLPPELLAEIAVKLNTFEDFTAFRSVCTSWRAAAAKDIFHGVKLPLLMLAQNKDDDSDEREFYSLSRRVICKAAVPEAKGKMCTDVRFGWVVAVARFGGELYLFKPFSSSPTIPLPNFHTFPEFSQYESSPGFRCVRRAILSANPSDTSDFMVFVLMNFVLGFWKNGDENWTRIKSEKTGFSNIGYCGHRMYATDYRGRLWSWDPSSTDLTQLQLVLTFKISIVAQPGGIMPYMVESTAGELLVITRDNIHRDGYQSAGTTYFEVLRVDVVKQNWEEIDDIGKDAIFIGHNATVSVSADDFPGVIKPNCIYFTDDCVDGYSLFEDDKMNEQLGYLDPNCKVGGKEMGIFDIKKESIERFGIESFCNLCPPFWVFP